MKYVSTLPEKCPGEGSALIHTTPPFKKKDPIYKDFEFLYMFMVEI